MNLTRNARRMLADNLSLEDALPTEMPVYVNSVAYLFGVSALSALGMLILSGLLLALFGPGWYHVSEAGHFVNSLHFWSVQVFLGAILLHLGTKLLTAAWRDGRWKTWMVGVLIFGLVNLAEARPVLEKVIELARTGPQADEAAVLLGKL